MSLRWELNPRPLAYKASALPLSYRGRLPGLLVVHRPVNTILILFNICSFLYIRNHLKNLLLDSTYNTRFQTRDFLKLIQLN